MHRHAFDFGVRTALTLVVAMVVVRRYGVLALATRNRVRHAAIGRARRSWSYIGSHTKAIVGNNLHAGELVHRLRRERQDMAWRTYTMNVRIA